MPELPEVETIRRDLDRFLKGRTVTGVSVLDPAALNGIGPNGRPRRNVKEEDFRKKLQHRRISGHQRRGKYLIQTFEQGGAIIVHLRMTGQLLVRAPKGGERIVFRYDQGPALCYLDRRRFGEVVYTDDWEKDPVISSLGEEPLENQFHAEVLRSKLKGRNASIHSLLLNQTIVAGLGNIYVTEALFRAGISPMKAGGRISMPKLEALVSAAKRVLQESVDNRGYSMSTYVDAMGQKGRSQMFTVCYGKQGQPCSICRTILKRRVITERGVVYCPRCQT